MLAPLIIHDERDRPGQQEVVVMLNDFSLTPPEEILAGLKKGGSMPKMTRKAAPMAPMTGMAQAAAAADLDDVKYDAFLANDRTLADPEIIKVEPGTVVLLRVINGSSMSNYHLDLGRLKGELIAVDGFAIVPVPGRSFPITTAQRLDIRVALPREPVAHPVVAVLEGERHQTGIVLVAGSAAVALLVLAEIRDPRWAVAYLLVFGVGTIAGMMLITMAIGAPFAYTRRRFAPFHRGLGVASGLLSLGFGLFITFQIAITDGLFAAHPHWTPH